MPPRKKPTSTRQKKADIQLKRAIKRGDVPPPEPKKNAPKPKASRRGPTGNPLGSAEAIKAARRLQSAFITLPPKFLEETKALAATLPLTRPLPSNIALFTNISCNAEDTDTARLSCPRRPKWRFDMSKKEVERNEEGLFRKWLEETDRMIEKWQNHEGDIDGKREQNDQDHITKAHHPVIPRSPTYFERNLEVWRQLWRVTEISQIILVLLDSRCPLIHFPPSLSSYLSDKKVILVLTKVDISGLTRANAWTEHLRKRYPNLPVVQVESYIERETKSAHQGRKRHEPYLPTTFRERLIETIRTVHADMLQPPDRIKEDQSRFQKWKPPVKKEIDWGNLLRGEEYKTGMMIDQDILQSDTQENDGEEQPITHDEQEPEYLTIGLIGQPNVGKSSLLNALFGESKVRASKTPGKTKHFQTLFWTPDVRLVDCPGLVVPSFIPMEMQVLCGILPISRISAIPSCIHYAAQLLPLESIYKLRHPGLSVLPAEDKRTWRDGQKPDTTVGKGIPLNWTAMDLLVAYANLKGWVTAKAGRPDVHRAGNAILRALAEGKIGWAFWPPQTDTHPVITDAEEGGIWIPHITVIESDEESAEGNGDENQYRSDESSDSEGVSDDENDGEHSGGAQAPGLGRFSALVMQDSDEGVLELAAE